MDELLNAAVAYSWKLRSISSGLPCRYHFLFPSAGNTGTAMVFIRRIHSGFRNTMPKERLANLTIIAMHRNTVQVASTDISKNTRLYTVYQHDGIVIVLRILVVQLLVKTGQFTTRCMGDRVIALKRQISLVGLHLAR